MTKAKNTREQFRGDPAGSFVIEEPEGFLERFIPDALRSRETERVNERFKVSRGSLLVPLHGLGAPMTNRGMKGIPRNLAAIAIAPFNSENNETIPDNRDFRNDAKALRVPVFVLGDQGAVFRFNPDGSVELR